MEVPLLCYSMGTIDSLIGKIAQLTDNHPMIEDLLKDIKSLKDDFLIKFAGGGATGKQVKVWMKQSREMIYDIEDWIDLKQKVTNNLGESDKKKIDQFKKQIEKARARCERYELVKEASNSDAEPPFSAAAPSEVASRRLFWEEKIVLVGIDGPKAELLNRLKDEQDELKVVSIHGKEGLGKAALVKEIYGDIYIKTLFKCHAFVSVGRDTSVRTILIEILSQVKSEEDDWQSMSCNEITTELWRFLRTKRYFICIVDIRSTQDSEAIICALPDNDLGSRILTTTSMKDIAKSCSSRPNDVVYQMNPLGETDSKRLFHNSVYVKEEEWPDHFKTSSNKIFEVCGGMPMAVIITASLLGRTSAEFSVQSKKLSQSILSEFGQFHSESQMMRKILDFSFADLPLPVRSCFLYLTSFSGNHDIKKGRLIRRWLAEGLIPERNGRVSWETAESYFDKLISRRLIQPTFDDNDDQPSGCTVHGVVFDFMKSLSKEENFITAGAELESGFCPYDKVRRISLDYGDDDEGDTLIFNTYCLLEEKSWVASSSDRDEAISLHLSRVRSLAFSGHAGRIPDLSAFKHVRVLDLEDAKGLENKQLESIGHLSLLRYLGLGGTNVTTLPEQIMALEDLTTLDLRKNRVSTLLQFRGTKLVSLLADQLIIPDEGMGEMQELEELSKVVLGPNAASAKYMAGLVHELGRLRMLGVRFSHLHGNNETDRQGVKHFLEELGKSKLHSLFLDNYQHQLLDILLDSWAHMRQDYLKKFELRIGDRLPQVPQKIASLVALTHLHIDVEAAEAQVIRTLGELPVLAVLKLYSYTSPSLTVSSKDGFQCLKVLWYNSQYGGGMGLRFDVGAMPQLRRLRVDLDTQKVLTPKVGDFDIIGIQHLAHLVQVHVTIDWMNTTLTPAEVEAAEDHIRNLVSLYPNNPVLALNRKRQRRVPKAAEQLVIAIHSLEEWSVNIDPNKLVVVHFTTGWCKASRNMAPVFANLAGKFRNVIFLKVDVEANDDMGTIAQQFDVDGVPTFLFIKEGFDVDRVDGADEEELVEKLEDQVALMF